MMGTRYHQIVDGEWIRPKRRKFREMCCDCHLVHDLDFRIVDGEIEFRATRNNAPRQPHAGTSLWQRRITASSATSSMAMFRRWKRSAGASSPITACAGPHDVFIMELNDGEDTQRHGYSNGPASGG